MCEKLSLKKPKDSFTASTETERRGQLLITKGTLLTDHQQG